MPWQKKTPFFDYGTLISKITMDMAASTINIISEGHYGDAEYIAAREAIAQADQVCMLGFGYNETNLDRLFGAHKMKTNNVYGTAYCVTNAYCNIIKELMKKKYNIDILEMKSAKIPAYLHDSSVTVWFRS